MRKKIQVIAMFFALVSVLFAGCKKEPNPQVAIVGKWVFSSIQAKSWENGVFKGEIYPYMEAGTTMEFKGDNTWLITTVSLSDGGSYSIIGNKIKIKSEQGETESEIAFPNNKTLKLSSIVERTSDGITYRNEYISEYVRK
ncbi:MAG TPA: hypothetical protein VEV16_11070 [Daejeonella sp.]|nr:hypothetical protein [Daejeonella sp.]